MILVTRHHDICAGHRVVGHENKCRHLHGHNYRVHFTVAAPQLDALGRVVDFGFIKTALCEWLEHNWDHKMLLWTEDPLWDDLHHAMFGTEADDSIQACHFNPTAENMARYLGEDVGPILLGGTALKLVAVVIEETRKCMAAWYHEEYAAMVIGDALKSANAEALR